GDVASSSIPIAILRYEVTNLTDKPLDVSVCGTIRNFIGRDAPDRHAKGNSNAYREGERVRGIYMTSEGVPSDDAAWGTMALTTSEAHDVSYRRSSTKDSWSNAILDFWDDFSADGLLTDKD